MDTHSGQAMPPGSIPEGSTSKSVANAAKISRDSWNTMGNNSPAEALAADKNLVRQEINPKTLGPNK